VAVKNDFINISTRISCPDEAVNRLHRAFRADSRGNRARQILRHTHLDDAPSWTTSRRRTWRAHVQSWLSPQGDQRIGATRIEEWATAWVKLTGELVLALGDVENAAEQ
jgi:hypothetical protein